MVKALGVLVVASAFAIGCAHTPTSKQARNDLVRQAEMTRNDMVQRDPNLQNLLQSSAGYIIFPRVTAGGLVVGGSAGEGVVFENGQATGFAKLTGVSAGAIAGGENYAELVIAKDQNALQRMKSGNFEFGAGASAVILQEGAAANAQFTNGVAVIVHPTQGAMVNASLSGQQIRITM